MTSVPITCLSILNQSINHQVIAKIVIVLCGPVAMAVHSSQISKALRDSFVNIFSM